MNVENKLENRKGECEIRSASRATKLTEGENTKWQGVTPQTREIIIFYFGQEGMCQAVAYGGIAPPHNPPPPSAPQPECHDTANAGEK